MESLAGDIVPDVTSSVSIAEHERLAGFPERFLSLLIDIIVIRLSILLILSPLKTLFQNLSTGNMVEQLGGLDSLFIYMTLSLILPFFVSFFYFVTFWVVGGETIGKKVFGLRVVGEDGEVLSVKNALLRYIGYFISSVLFVGFIWVVFDEKKQGWHDRLATSYVVRV